MHDTLVVVRLPVAHSPAVGGELGLVLQGNVLPLDLNKYLNTRGHSLLLEILDRVTPLTSMYMSLSDLLCSW